MNRRGFLNLLAGAIAVPTILLPKRTFFLPPPGGWPVNMSAYLTPPGAWAPMGWRQPDKAMFELIEEITRDVERASGLHMAMDTASGDDMTAAMWYRVDLRGNLRVEAVKHFAPMRLHDKDLIGHILPLDARFEPLRLEVT